MSQFRYAIAVYVLIAAGIFAPKIYAAPWTSTEDLRLRLELQRLNDVGLINLPLASWPIPWADIKYGLDRLSAVEIDPRLRQTVSSSLRYVRDQLNRNYDSRSLNKQSGTSYGISAANSASLFNSYGHAMERGAVVKIESEWQGQILSAGLRVQYASDPIDEKRWRYDDSYVAANLGNWNLSVGATERWWGPGWQSSLILSNNARPVPALSINRTVSYAPTSSWFSWIGPWHLTSFIGQLEGDRVIPEAKLFAMRFSFKPFSNIEFGFSRAAQFGGVGRSQSLLDLGKVLIGKDENQPGGPGNQLGGFDARFSWIVADVPAAIYGQLIGEDEAGYLPSKYIFLAGTELSGVPINRNYLSIFFEYSDTMSGRIVGDERPNTAYGHSTYKSGYRYHGRPIGSSLDNDSRSATLGATLIRSDDSIWRVALSQLDLNTDNIAASNQVSKKHHKLHHAVLKYRRTVKTITLDLGLEWNSSTPDTNLTDDDRFGIYAGFDYRI